jgi:hypothetical protein
VLVVEAVVLDRLALRFAIPKSQPEKAAQAFARSVGFSALRGRHIVLEDIRRENRPAELS